MNLTRRNLLLLVVALALAVPTAMQLSRDIDSFVDVGRVPLMFEGFTEDNVQALLLASPKAEQPQPEPNQPPRIAYDFLSMQRTNKGWVVAPVPGQAPGELTGAPVSQLRVRADVMAHLAAIPADEGHVVHADATPEQLATLGLDEAHAFVLRAVDARDNVVAELLVGKDAGAGQIGTEAVRGVFVRKSGSNDVVLYECQQLWRRDVSSDGWLDRALFTIEPDHVRRFVIQNASTRGKPVVFERAKGLMSWVLAEPRDDLGAVRQAEVEGLLQRLRHTTVQRYVRPLSRAGDMASLGLFPPQLRLELTVVEEGAERTIELEVGSQLPSGPEFYLTCNESAFVMTWPGSTVVQFEVDVERRLFDPKPQ